MHEEYILVINKIITLCKLYINCLIIDNSKNDFDIL